MKFLCQIALNIFCSVLGAFGGAGTPVPIPNTEVKRSSADGTLLGESRPVPRTLQNISKHKNVPKGRFYVIMEKE